jgi:hypothetical protein
MPAAIGSFMKGFVQMRNAFRRMGPTRRKLNAGAQPVFGTALCPPAAGALP